MDHMPPSRNDAPSSVPMNSNRGASSQRRGRASRRGNKGSGRDVQSITNNSNSIHYLPENTGTDISDSNLPHELERNQGSGITRGQPRSNNSQRGIKHVRASKRGQQRGRGQRYSEHMVNTRGHPHSQSKHSEGVSTASSSMVSDPLHQHSFPIVTTGRQDYMAESGITYGPHAGLIHQATALHSPDYNGARGGVLPGHIKSSSREGLPGGQAGYSTRGRHGAHQSHPSQGFVNEPRLLPFQFNPDATYTPPFQPESSFQIAQRPSQPLLISLTGSETGEIARGVHFTTSDSTLQQTTSTSPLAYIYTLGSSSTSSNSDQLSKPPTDLVSTALNTFFGSLYMSVLDDLLIPTTELAEHGYQTHELTIGELNDKRRCTGCNKFWGKLHKAQENALKMASREERERAEQVKNTVKRDPQSSANNIDNFSKSQSAQANLHISKAENKKLEEKKPVLRCKFHAGTVIRQQPQPLGDPNVRFAPRLSLRNVWSCCNEAPSSEPCSGREHHTVLDQNIQYLAAQWQTYPTPRANRQTQFTHRAAVALDCEMGISKSGDSELIRVTVIDYFTNETLIDRLVSPTVPMAHLNTRYSGVTPAMLKAASARGESIRGRDAAREEVWRFVGPETVVVAHSGNNDLSSLRWRHNRILDTFSIEDVKDRAIRKAEMEREKIEKDKNKDKISKTDAALSINQDPKVKEDSKNKDKGGTKGAEQEPAKAKRVKGSGRFSLKTLARTRLGREIQTGSSGHDSLEDALATRDLAHWLVRAALEGTQTRIGTETGTGEELGTEAHAATPYS